MNIDKILEELDNYFKNTPKEEIDKDIEEINKMGTEGGITFEEYCKLIGYDTTGTNSNI